MIEPGVDLTVHNSNLGLEIALYKSRFIPRLSNTSGPNRLNNPDIVLLSELGQITFNDAFQPHNMNRRIRLLTFDAFGTLFTPRESIGKQYLELARRHGLNTLDCDIKIENSFRNGE